MAQRRSCSSSWPARGRGPRVPISRKKRRDRARAEALDREAASELEWARKLLPGHPDPRVNLALALEAAGKTSDALAAYDAARDVWPGYLPAVMGAASLSLRAGRDETRLNAWLGEIAFRAGEGRWREWARERLSAVRK